MRQVYSVSDYKLWYNAAMKSRNIALGAALLALLVGILYAPTGTFGFLHLDDPDYTFRCPFVCGGLSWANAKEAFLNARHGGIWMPITYISYMCDVSLFGLKAPGAFHLVNVALHMLNTLLLLTLAWRLAQPRGRGIWIVLAVAFWSLHPQRAEAVAWIASRKELLWAGFTLAGLLCWESAGRRPLFLTAAYACCALACMSKPTAMCFPLLALCVDLAAPAGRRTRLIAYLPLLLMAAATGALAMYSQTHPEGHEVLALFSASLPWRLLNAAVAIGLSLFQMVVPAGIHLDYRAVPGQWPVGGLLGCLVFAGCVAAGAWCLVGRGLRTRRERRVETPRPTNALTTNHYALATSLWFLAALLPTLGIFGSFGEHARADRFLYVPMMAVVLAVATRMAGGRGGDGQDTQDTQDTQEMPTGKWQKWAEGLTTRKWLGLAVGIYVAVVAGMAWPVVGSYRSDYDVFTRTLKIDPNNGRALAHIGQAECARGEHDRGIELLRRSQTVRPRDDTAAKLAYALAMRGHSADFDEIHTLCRAFDRDHQLDKKGQALEALGMTYKRQRKYNEAISCLYDSIRAPQRFYSNEDAMLRLAVCLCNAGRQGEAIKWLEQLAPSKRQDIQQKALQSLEALKRNPRTVLFLD